ncbi:MAG: hypothetical protein E7395_07705, partial [Ruminococcaceae bacterium]|nr:hypothetical protein [Oscillospiraceae bacterium]
MDNLSLGIDIGSTTAKLVLMSGDITIYQKYQRHLSKGRQTTIDLLREMQRQTNASKVCVTISGSAGMGLAEAAKLPFGKMPLIFLIYGYITTHQHKLG